MPLQELREFVVGQLRCDIVRQTISDEVNRFGSVINRRTRLLSKLAREASNGSKSDGHHRKCGEDDEDDDHNWLVAAVSGSDADALSKKLTVIGGVTEEKF